jgi:hypothetical protein
LRNHILGKKQEPQAEPVTQPQQAQKQEPVQRKEEPETKADKDAKLTPAQTAMHSLGTLFYGREWESQRKVFVSQMGQRRTPKMELTSSKDLAPKETGQIVAYLENAVRGYAEEMATELFEDTEDYSAWLVKNHQVDSTDALFGLGLYKAVSDLVKLNKEKTDVDFYQK